MQLKNKVLKLEKLLETRILAKKIKWFDRVTSTQRRLKKVLKEKQPVLSYLFVSDIQTDGYGRFRRKWFSPEGGLWFSVSLKNKFKPKDVTYLIPLCAVTVSDVIDAYIRKNNELNTAIKYPNDIMINSKKAGGCLVETSIKGKKVEWVLIGIGININNKLPDEIKNISISLKDATGEKIPIIDLLADILNKLDKNLFYFEREKKYFLKEYYRRIFPEEDLKWIKMSSGIMKLC